MVSKISLRSARSNITKNREHTTRIYSIWRFFARIWLIKTVKNSMSGFKQFRKDPLAIYTPPCTSQTLLVSNMCRSHPPCFTFSPISRSLPWISSTMTSRVSPGRFWLTAQLKPNHFFSFAFSDREIISTNQVQAILTCSRFTLSLETRCINCCM